LSKKGPKEKAIGFIDSDKKKPKYYEEFKIVDKAKNVQLLKHTKKDQYLVVVKPAMDGFVFSLCIDLGIDISSYHLPKQFEAFLSFTKKESIIKDSNFRNLLNTIKQKKAPAVERIRFWVGKYSEPY
ncbi:MAG TPA: hypothetical protein VHW43_03635, partial [Puia sp.]|nr:hypothetical protein [Puia sp.]